MFDKQISEYTMEASTMRLSKQFRKTVTFVNEVYNKNMTAMDCIKKQFLAAYDMPHII